MAEKNPEKLQKPLMDKNGSFYPLTTYDQIIMPDNSRWNGKSGEASGAIKSVNGAKPDENGNVNILPSDIGALHVGANGEITDGTHPVSVNATTLNGMSFEQLVQKIISEAVYQ